MIACIDYGGANKGNARRRLMRQQVEEVCDHPASPKEGAICIAGVWSPAVDARRGRVEEMRVSLAIA